MRAVYITFLLCCGASLAHAHWFSTTYTLKGGWNSIYLHGDATHMNLDDLSAQYPEIEEIWRWNPNPDEVLYIDSPLLRSAGTAEWSTWTSDGSVLTLTELFGQSAYLVKCSGSSSDSYSVTLQQRALAPAVTWERSGANLHGFPSSNASGSYPYMADYFATFTAAIASDVQIFKYVGGEISASNPIQVFSTTFESLDRNQAYWFDSDVVGNFYAPLEVSVSGLEGLDFGRTGSTLTVTLNNRTTAVSTVTIKTEVSSEAAPAGETFVTGRVPLLLRTYDAASLSWTESAITEAFTQEIGPESTVEVSFGIDRGAMSSDPGAFYASLLRVTDNTEQFDILLPVTAEVASLAGLWLGTATVSDVASQVDSSPGSTTPRSFNLRYILHVADDGTARLLSQVFIGTLADEGNPEGLCTLESGLDASAKDRATRLSVAHLPLDLVTSEGSGTVALGSILERTVSIAFNDPSNPFVHQYHPDHDNKDARADGTSTNLAAGDESYEITRQIQFEFTNDPPEGTSSSGWGSTVIGGTYTEILDGLHKDSLEVSGTFTFSRISELGALTIN
jgi:hypothetical protein